MPSPLSLNFDTGCLFSVVKNISGGTMNFPFLPPHGKVLEADEEYSIFGSVLEAVTRGDRFGGRFTRALETSIERHYLEIRSLPKPIMTDETTDAVKVISLDNGSLVLDDPCWEVSLSL